ncbi:MAG: response regulator transcription factor [Nitrospiraceae bacterium]|nr:response regulator transcription factor [Nitrospiraceae bacterium]
MNQLRVVIADDRPQIVTSLQRLLEPEYRVVGTAENGRCLIAAVEALQPDFVLTDINMPVMNGIDATRELHGRYPDLCLIVHSSDARPAMIAAAYKAGASGYVIKGSAESLVLSVRTLVAPLRKSLNESTMSMATTYRPPSMTSLMPSSHRNV